MLAFTWPDPTRLDRWTGYRQFTFTYTHKLGRAILYDGRMRHGAEPITSGSRTNLVLWLHS